MSILRIGVMIGWIALGLLGFMSLGVNAEEQEKGQIGMLFGSASAPVTLIEYASLSCPHCARFHRDIFPRLKADYLDTGIAKLYVRDYPHNNVGVLATVTLRCADEKVRPGLYEVLIENQNHWLSASDARQPLREYASLAGINAQQMEGCLQDKALIETLFSDIKAAEDKNIEAVPTIFVNGKKTKASYEKISAAIEAVR